MALTLTRVPVSLVDKAQPIRWIGKAADRDALRTATGADALTLNDRKYLFLEVDDAGVTQNLYMLKDVTDTGPVWTLVTSKVVPVADIDGIDNKITTVMQPGMDLKLDKDIAQVTAIADDGTTKILPTSVKLFAYNGSAPGSVTIDQIRDYVATAADKLFLGYFANDTALKAVTGPVAGNYAVVGTTDSIWVWNAEAKSGAGEWEDTRITGTVDVSTQVIAGTGLTGGGALGSDVTLNVAYGTTTGTACQGDDTRLEKGIKWAGTKAEREALVPTAGDVNKVWLQTAEGDDTATIWVLTSSSPVTWIQAGGVPAKENISVVSGVVNAGQSQITLDKAYPTTGYYLEVFLSGVRQMSNSWSLDTATSKVITLGGQAPQDIEYDVVVHPKG